MGHQAVRNIVHVLQHVSLQSFNPFQSYDVYSLEVPVSLIASKFVALQSPASRAVTFLQVSPCPRGVTLAPPLGMGAGFWVPALASWRPGATIKFQACSQYSQMSLKVCPRSPKVIKITAKRRPKTIPKRSVQR